MTIERGYDGLNSKQVNDRIGKELSKVARKYLKNNHITFYTVRAIYANYAVQTVKAKAVDTQKFIADILGHDKGDLVTAHSYESILIVDEEVNQKFVKPKATLPIGVVESKEIRKIIREEEAPKPKDSKRLGKLNALTPMIEKESKAMQKLHSWIVDQITFYPSQEITQSWIRKNRATSMPLIKRYIEIIGFVAKG